MSRYKTPFPKRMHESKRRKQRYREEAEYRLKRINYHRAKKGLPLAHSIDDVGIFQRQRNEQGRFVG